MTVSASSEPAKEYALSLASHQLLIFAFVLKFWLLPAFLILSESLLVHKS